MTEPPPDDDTPNAGSAQPPLVLIVEDDARIADVLRLTLEDIDLHVAIARDGEEGLRLGMELQPALVMLDMMLPLLSGEAVAARLREQPDAGPPIVVLSAAADIARIARTIGAVGFLAKPFDLDEVVALVERILRISSPQTS